jgi:hypothetical protein
MFIIFGMRSRAGVIGRGTFMCPQCGTDRSYLHKRMRRWFTLFFLPVIPLNTMGEFVQCETCKNAYKTSVLAAPTLSTLQAELGYAIREAVTELVRIERSPAAEAAAAAVLTSFSDRLWTTDEVAHDVEHLDTQHLTARLSHLSGILNEQGRERFVGSCAEVVAGGNVISSEARARITEIATELLMSPAHARGIIDETLERAQA